MAELKLSKINKKPFVIAFFYAIITIFAVMHHETWVDEAQVWMLAKYTSIGELFAHLKYEGHPPLFYLIVFPFAKLFKDIIWMQLICWLSSVLAVFLLWNNSKFNTLTKTVITLSAPFLYFFPVIARSYSIAPALIFILASLYNKKENHPYLYAVTTGLLANLLAIFYPFAFILGAEFVYKSLILNKIKEKKFIISSIILLLLLLISPITIMLTKTSGMLTNYVTPEFADSFTRVTMHFIYNSFDTFCINKGKTFSLFNILMAFGVVCSLIFSFIVLFKKNVKMFYFALFMLVFQLLSYILFYPYHIYPTRIFSFYIILLFAFWITLKEGKNSKSINAAVIVLFLLTYIGGIKSYIADIFFDYTPSRSVANYIKENIDLKNSKIYITDPVYSEAIAYYLAPDYYLIKFQDKKPLKYYKIFNYKIASDREVSKYFNYLRKHSDKNNLYILVNCNFYGGYITVNYDNQAFELIYETKSSITPSETFKLYKYKG